MTAARRDVLLGAAFATLSLAAKLSIIRFGLPYQFSADESYILKDPFKISLLYASGDFSAPTNLLFWVLQLWFGLVFAAGRLLGEWPSLSQFQNLLVAESPRLILMGRVFAVLCSAAAIWILAGIATRTIRDARLRWLLVATLALNPLDLVSSPWLKFDGPGMLLNALLLDRFVRYLQDHSVAIRRQAYLGATIACAYRTDFAVLLVALLAYDVWTRQPFRPIAWALAGGVAAYGAITLAPATYLFSKFLRSAPHTVAVVNSFEQNISSRFLGLTPTSFGQAVGRNLAFYGGVGVAIFPAIVAAIYGALTRDRVIGVALMIAAGLLGPVLLYPANGTRYALLPSVYLLCAAAWTLRDSPRPLALGIMGMTFIGAASLAGEVIVTLRRAEDPRLTSARYLIEHSAVADPIALENYMNPGLHAEVDECADDLALKAETVKRLGIGTGETLRARSEVHRDPCRRIVEVTEVDRYAASEFAHRWINTYDSATLPTWFSSNERYDRNLVTRPQRFVDGVIDHYTLEAAFEPHYADPRVRWLLSGTPYHMPLFVYRRVS